MPSPIQLLRRIGINGLLVGIIFSAFLGYFIPEWGSKDSPIPWGIFTTIGISFIFFFYGVKLDPISLRKGIYNWRLHLLIQSGTYLVFPLVVTLIMPLLPFLTGNLKVGLWFLSALPSTVSASVVLVNIAKGNLPAAIFNASISSLLGVFITPIWMLVLTGNETSGVEFTGILTQLMLKILLPVILGIVLHRRLYPVLNPYFSKLKYVDQAVIMAIVYTSFSDAFVNDVFSGYSSSSMLGLVLVTGFLYFLIGFFLFFIAKSLGWGMADRITTVFCGAKKSLIQGVVMGKVIFSDPLVLSIVILPVMIFHIQQLIYGSLLAGFFQKKMSSQDT
ncbi:bile acid:sodium symporter family protein [Algoriphagus namhaensis]|uniref:Bile acid:sodium symporter family protein n=1 Tax=Algoriphagus namhaensis TaxID=915353 RepID=A0ABV8AVL3_9BACT